MTAPRRIHDDHDLGGRLRRAVRAARAVGPTYDVGRGADRFEAMLAGLPEVSVPGAASSNTAKPGAGSIASTSPRTNAFVTKATLVTGVLVLFGAGIYALSSRNVGGATESLEGLSSGVAPSGSRTINREAPPSTPPLSTRLAPGFALREAPAVGEPASETNVKPSAPIAMSSSGEGIAIDALPSASSAKPAAGATAKRPTFDDREREVLHLAKLQRLAATDPTQAIDLAKAGHAEFPRGILYQEREVILVEALAGAGRKSEASERARAFVKAYPKNPSASHLRALAAPDAP